MGPDPKNVLSLTSIESHFITTFIMDAIRDYKISVPSAAIDELHQRLAISKFPDVIEDSDEWDRGTPAANIKRITKYWLEEFKWDPVEERLNRLPQFETTISLDGFDPFELHFIHQKSANPNAIPLLFVHGCTCPHNQPQIIYEAIS